MQKKMTQKKYTITIKYLNTSNNDGYNDKDRHCKTHVTPLSKVYKKAVNGSCSPIFYIKMSFGERTELGTNKLKV